MLRGNNRQKLFFDLEDTQHFFQLIEDGVNRYGHRIYAFCCMTNHVHLAVQVGEVSVSKIIQNLAFRYAHWVNRRQKRVGHLFQGRFRGLPVETDEYALELIRYIHLNAVRGGLVGDPTDYPWSSHRAYLGLESWPWLTIDWVLGMLGPTRSEARRVFRDFVAAGLAEEPTSPEKPLPMPDAGRDLVAESRSRNSTARSPSVSFDDLVRLVCQEFDTTEDALRSRSQVRRLSEARAVLGWLSVRTGVGAVAHIASRLQRDPSTLSKALVRLEMRRKSDRELRSRLDQILERLAGLSAEPGDPPVLPDIHV
jgi:REP element-mobilizing transposase RayT